MMRTKKLAAAVGAIAAATVLVSTINAPAALAGGNQKSCYGALACEVFVPNFPGGQVIISADVTGENAPVKWDLSDPAARPRCYGDFQVSDPLRHWQCVDVAKGDILLYASTTPHALNGYDFYVSLRW